MANVTLRRPVLTDEEREKRMDVTRAIAAKIWKRVMLEELQKEKTIVENREIS